MKRNVRSRWLEAVVRVAVLGIMASALTGAGSEPKKDKTAEASSYNEGLAMVEAGDFAGARTLFERAVKDAPDDADALNMLAFTQRKTGDLASAFETYGRALEIREKFPQARQYLGEAHLTAIMQEILTLRSYGPEGEEHLAALIDELAAAAERASAMRPEGAAATKW